MHRSLIAVSLIAVLSCTAAAEDTPASAPEALYVLSTHANSANGQPLTMTIRETKRTPELSIVAVEYVSGGSTSSLFLVQGLCGVMGARQKKVGVAEQISENPVKFRITFPDSAIVQDTKGLPRMVLSESNCFRISGR